MPYNEPSPLETRILSRRFGDCKDDATLLTALLAAKGIAAEEVLIGAMPTYRLAKTATVSAFNHAIVYIPALDQYVDPTAAFGNFNRLPSSDSGKPVVRVSAKGAVVARTPESSAEDNVVELDSHMTPARDGGRAFVSQSLRPYLLAALLDRSPDHAAIVAGSSANRPSRSRSVFPPPGAVRGSTRSSGTPGCRVKSASISRTGLRAAA